MRHHTAKLRIAVGAQKPERSQAQARSRVRFWLYCTISFAGLGLCQPAAAQIGTGLDFLNGRFEFEGERLELTTPDGVSCRFTEADKPSFSVGAGIARPQIIPGIYGEDPISARLGGSDPVAGIALRVPFGGSARGNCDRILAIETAKQRYQTAKAMFEDGLITEEQLREIAAQTFNVINQPGG